MQQCLFISDCINFNGIGFMREGNCKKLTCRASDVTSWAIYQKNIFQTTLVCLEMCISVGDFIIALYIWKVIDSMV